METTDTQKKKTSHINYKHKVIPYSELSDDNWGDCYWYRIYHIHCFHKAFSSGKFFRITKITDLENFPLP